MELLFAGLAALAVLLGGWAVSGLVQRKAAAHALLERRLATVAGITLHDGRASGLLKDTRLSRIEWLDRLLVRLPAMPSFARAARQAGFEHQLTGVLLAPLVLGGVTVALVAASDGGTSAALLSGVAAAVVPVAVVHRRRRARALSFGEQLPDALDLMRAALQAGHSLVGSVTVIAEEFPEPSAGEFKSVAEEIRLGLPLRDALYNLCGRVDNHDLPILTVGVLVAQESGGNLAEVFDNISHTVRERFKLEREMQVLTAQGRMSGNVLTTLPLLLGIALYVFSPQYFKPMFEDPRGKSLMIYAAASLTLGQLFMRRLTRLAV